MIKTNMDRRNELLGNLPEIKVMLGSFVVEQRVHNQNLEKILEKLHDIKKDTSTLPAINVGIDNLNTKFGSFTTHLERILEKLKE